MTTAATTGTVATLVEYNVFRKNSAATVEGDLHQLVRDHAADLIAVNEASSATSDKGVDAFVDRIRWRAFQPREADELGILWNPDVWRAEPQFGVRRISDRGPVGYLPPRHLIWQGLVHRPTGTRHLVYCTHITQGYAKDDPELPHGAWRDHAARTALLRIAATTATHMAELDQYQHHHLLGDLNARQNNRDEWWYPHPLLEAGWVRDTMPKSIDYVLHSHMAADNGLRVVKRYSTVKGMDSDHAAQVKRVRIA